MLKKQVYSLHTHYISFTNYSTQINIDVICFTILAATPPRTYYEDGEKEKKKNSRIIFSDDDDSILAVRGALKFFFFPSQLQINLVLENVVVNYVGV